VTNVEEEHVDFYRGGRDEVEAAFRAFCANCGHVVACWDDPGVRRSIADVSTPLVRYGFGTDADVVVRETATSAGARGTVQVAGERVEIDLPVRGRHNLLNAAAALGVAAVLGLDLPEAARALSTFTGVRRRFEDRGTAGGAAFVDDYAHHPTEVAATLETARTNGGRVVAVFQPHRYTRTKAMWRALGESLRSADVILITDVYPAGEDPIPGVSGKLLVDALAEREPGKPILYVPRRSEIARLLAPRVRPGDLVITLGAGDITMLGDEIQELLKNQGRTGRPPYSPSSLLGSEV
jgi:UDP-N-acetylmuramate--alanine ligase